MSQYADYTDAVLLDLLREDDQLSFETIYHRYAGDINRFSYSKTGNREHAEEIVQQVFVWLWDNRRELRTITNLKTYLFESAKNRILNDIRASKVRERYAASFVQFASTYSNPVEQQLAAKELRETIARSLGDLPEKCQTAFRLSRFHHMEISGIAKEMAVSRRTVENYISQALRHLRKKVQDPG